MGSGDEFSVGVGGRLDGFFLAPIRVARVGELLENARFEEIIAMF
jgi:hypothetical protein